MVFTADADLAARARSLCDHGAASVPEENGSGHAFLLSDYDGLGFNFRLTDIQGAVGSVQMDRLPEVLAGRRARAEAYTEALAGLDWLATPTTPPGVTHGWQAYVCLYPPEEPSLANVRELNERRNALMAAPDERGIATRQGTHAPVLIASTASATASAPTTSRTRCSPTASRSRCRSTRSSPTTSRRRCARVHRSL